ncbi:unnamed protein product [Arabidopsis lyrata]|nr:unnamed protein product [Arabidopsis lyrata]
MEDDYSQALGNIITIGDYSYDGFGSCFAAIFAS